jgi:hypothetical protein
MYRKKERKNYIIEENDKLRYSMIRMLKGTNHSLYLLSIQRIV